MSLLESIAQWQGEALKIAPPSDTNLLPAVGGLSGPAFFPEGFGLGDPPLTLQLTHTLPFEWEAMLAAFRAHQLPHLEAVDDVAYERIVTTKQGIGWSEWSTMRCGRLSGSPSGMAS